MMELNLVEFRKRMADPINRVAYQGERVILERHGKSVAALVSMEDLALLEKLEDEADIKAARAALREGGQPIPWEQVKADLSLRGLGKAGAQHAKPKSRRPKA